MQVMSMPSTQFSTTKVLLSEETKFMDSTCKHQTLGGHNSAISCCEKNQTPIIATIIRTNDCGRVCDITEGEKSSCQELLPSIPCNDACNLRKRKKRKRKHLLKGQRLEHLPKKMEDDLVANVENSRAISSDILSVGGIITRYFTDFSDVSSFYRRASPFLASRSVKSLPRAGLGAKIQLDIATTCTIQTSPWLFSPPLPTQQENTIPSDYICRRKVGRNLLKAKSEIENLCSSQRPLISLFKTQVTRPVDISPCPMKFSVFEISGDDD